MIKKIIISIVISCIVVSILCYSYAEASKIYINKTWNMQQKSHWCWVACAQNSVKNLFGTTVSQKEAVIHVLGSDKNIGGTNAQTDKAAEYFSNNRLVYGHTATGTIKGFEFLKNKLDIGYTNILSAGLYSSEQTRKNGHDVLMVGYEIKNKDNYIYYYDPYDGKLNYCKYKAFKDGSYNSRKYDGTIYNVNVC